MTVTRALPAWMRAQMISSPNRLTAPNCVPGYAPSHGLTATVFYMRRIWSLPGLPIKPATVIYNWTPTTEFYTLTRAPVFISAWMLTRLNPLMILSWLSSRVNTLLTHNLRGWTGPPYQQRMCRIIGIWGGPNQARRLGSGWKSLSLKYLVQKGGPLFA